MQRKWTGLIHHIVQFTDQILAQRYEICLYCKGRSRKGRGWNESSSMRLCGRCRESISWIDKLSCHICGRYEVCYDCRRRSAAFFTMNRSAVSYSPEMREWLARYKYRGDERMLPLFIEMLRHPYEALLRELRRVPELPQPAFDCITFVPLSAERLAERGFNQAEQFAAGIGRIYCIQVIPLLRRTYHTGKQSYKTRGQRLEDLQGAFAFHAEGGIVSYLHAASEKHPVHILLVDDVYTTGSTINLCASVIRSNLEARVYGMTWAR